MTIAYPLALPSTRQPRQIDFRIETFAGKTESPFSGSATVFDWGLDRWLATLTWGEMGQADAAAVEAFLLALRGPVGSFLLGDPLRPAPAGSWAGQSPLVNGALQAGLTLAIDGLTAGATGRAGDWFQLGTGATSRLYRLTADFTANGSGAVTLDFVPQLRGSPADNAALTLAAAKGLFMLSNNVRGWSLADVRDSGISLDCVEDLRGL
jgi:hypothetical protein